MLKFAVKVQKTLAKHKRFAKKILLYFTNISESVF